MAQYRIRARGTRGDRNEQHGQHQQKSDHGEEVLPQRLHTAARAPTDRDPGGKEQRGAVVQQKAQIVEQREEQQSGGGEDRALPASDTERVVAEKRQPGDEQSRVLQQSQHDGRCRHLRRHQRRAG